jgi:O-antigen ligase
MAAFVALSADYYTPIAVVAGVLCLYGLVKAIRYTTLRPEWLLCFLAALGILTDAAFLTDIQRPLLHYGLLILFCVPVLPNIARLPILREGGFRLYLCYFAWAAFTITYSPAPLESIARLMASVLSFLAIAACMITVNSEEEDAPRLLARYLVGCIITLAVALAGSIVIRGAAWQSPLDSFSEQYIEQLAAQSVTEVGLDRFRAIFSNANTVGMLALVAISAGLVVWRSASRRQRAGLATVIAVLIGTDILADSRTPLVALAVGVAAYLLWRYRTRGAIAIAAMLCMGIVLSTFLTGDFREYTSRGEGDLTGRTELWRFVAQQIYARPILGYGYASGGAILKSRFSPLWDAMWNGGPHTSLHNGYIDHMVSVGVPATAFWLYIMLRPWVYVFRQSDNSFCLKSIFFLIVVPLLVYNFAEAGIGDCDDAIGALFGVCWVIAEQYRLRSASHVKALLQQNLAHEPSGVRAILDNQC